MPDTLTGNLILTVMLAFAEYERGMIVERTQSAKMALRQNPDFKDGRPRKYTDAQMQIPDNLNTHSEISWTFILVWTERLFRAERNDLLIVDIRFQIVSKAFAYENSAMLCKIISYLTFQDNEMILRLESELEKVFIPKEKNR